MVLLVVLLAVSLLQAVPTPPDIPTPPDVVSVILGLVQNHQWPTLAWLAASLVIGLLVRVLKGDSTLPLPNIPPNIRIWVVFGLGIAGGVAFKVFAGGTLQSALAWGVSAAIAAIIGHETVIESLRGGKEIQVPLLTKKPIPPAVIK